MKDFLLLIKGENGNPMENLSPEEKQVHIEKVGAYIQGLVQQGKMKAADPLEETGVRLRKNGAGFKDGPYNETKEVVLGYYMISAESIEEVVELAKQDPRFEDGDWIMEVRPILRVEGIN